MYIWTDESRAIMDEIRDYIVDRKVIPDAPNGTQEKFDKMMSILEDREEELLSYMFN